IIKVKIKKKFMNNEDHISQIIANQGILPLYFNPDETVSVEVLKAIYKAGIKAVEYTNRGEAALRNFKKLIKVRDDETPGLMLGIGTIKNLEQAENYIDAGADFMVSPGFVKEVADYASAKNVFYTPGCMTPSEVIDAENSGIKFIKIFPG